MNAKPGDLIEIFRGMYQHWAVYIDGDEVVHLVTTDDYGSGPQNSILSVDSNIAQVRRQKIWEVVGNDEFRINNLLDDKYQPHERQIIVRDACRMVGHVLPYSVATYNCEHFVTQLRYGKSESRQVKEAVEIGAAATAGFAIAALGAGLIAGLLKDDEES
ncbi:phospholipase A and acyltransferase 4-like [Channa argus]|uniref:phospholipase A and acyltransferase 4-like n=1 Tax=Channa argus TaxID=215402 RepID=UPI002946E0EC|nr:hypothetical protein Q8A73_017886 [Channa argus]